MAVFLHWHKKYLHQIFSHLLFEVLQVEPNVGSCLFSWEEAWGSGKMQLEMNQWWFTIIEGNSKISCQRVLLIELFTENTAFLMLLILNGDILFIRDPVSIYLLDREFKSTSNKYPFLRYELIQMLVCGKRVINVTIRAELNIWCSEHFSFLGLLNSGSDLGS